MKNSQTGLSILEVLFSLAIMGVIFAIIANYYYTQNKTYLQVSKAATQIQQLASISYEWQTAQSQTTFTDISLSALQAAGLLNPKDNYSQIDPWGGAISIAADKNDARYLLITLPKIPANVCANLANRMANIAHQQQCAGGNYTITL